MALRTGSDHNSIERKEGRALLLLLLPWIGFVLMPLGFVASLSRDTSSLGRVLLVASPLVAAASNALGRWIWGLTNAAILTLCAASIHEMINRPTRYSGYGMLAVAPIALAVFISLLVGAAIVTVRALRRRNASENQDPPMC